MKKTKILRTTNEMHQLYFIIEEWVHGVTHIVKELLISFFVVLPHPNDRSNMYALALLSYIFWATKHSQNLENDVETKNNPTPSISQLKIKPYSLALEKGSILIFSIPITKIKARPLHFFEFLIVVLSIFGIFNKKKKIHGSPPFHIRFLYQKNIYIFLSTKLTIKIK